MAIYQAERPYAYDAEGETQGQKGKGYGNHNYNGSPIHTEHYICDCGFKTKFNSGDEAGVARRMDLIARLHRKKCPLTSSGNQKYIEKTEFKIPKKGKARIVDEVKHPL